MSYLFPVPARPQRSLLDFKAEHGGVFSEDEATMDMMLIMDRGETKPERFLAKRWGWNPARVHRQKKALEAAAKEWREWNSNTAACVKQAEAEVKQAEAKSRVISSKRAASEAEVKQAEAEVKQPLYIHPRASELDITTELDIENSDNSDNNRNLSVDAGARETPSPPFDLSFLSERDEVYEPDIRECLAGYRQTDARELLIHRWRRRQVPPTQAILGLLQTHGWEVFAAGVVIASDDNRPNVKFLAAICQRLTEQRHATRTPEPPAPVIPDQSGSGIPVYDITTGAPRPLHEGVPAWRPGGHQPPRRNQGAYRRPGERSWREALIASGYSDAEIAAMPAPFTERIGPVNSADRPGDGAGVPLLPVIRLRA